MALRVRAALHRPVHLRQLLLAVLLVLVLVLVLVTAHVVLLLLLLDVRLVHVFRCLLMLCQHRWLLLMLCQHRWLLLALVLQVLLRVVQWHTTTRVCSKEYLDSIVQR